MSDSKSKRRSKADIARENGSKSKGAVTPEGKLRAATASLVHGLTSKSVVLANECPHKYEGLRQSFFDEWQPAGITEEGYVTQMANAYWRLCRVWAIETGLLDSALFGKREEFENAYSTYTGGLRASDAVGGLNLANRVNIETVQRYERMYERSYERAATSLCRLRKLRGLKQSPGPLQKPSTPPCNLPGSTDHHSLTAPVTRGAPVTQSVTQSPPAAQPNIVTKESSLTPESPVAQASVPSASALGVVAQLDSILCQLRSAKASALAVSLAALAWILKLWIPVSSALRSTRRQKSRPSQNVGNTVKNLTNTVEKEVPDEASQLPPDAGGSTSFEHPVELPPISMHEFYQRYSGTFSYPERFNYTMIYTPNPIYRIPFDPDAEIE